MVGRLRIAQLAPVEGVSPRSTSGVERVVDGLVEALRALGHEVTTFASHPSKTWSDSPTAHGPDAADGHDDALGLEDLVQCRDDFDLVHNHLDWMPFPLARRLGLPMVTTLHGRLDQPGLADIFRHYPDQPCVSISMAQRRPLHDIDWIANVPPGLPVDTFRLGDGAGGWLAYVGRLAPDQGVEAAVDIAVAAGLPLRIGGSVTRLDRPWFEAVLRPRLEHPLVQHVGPVSGEARQELLGGALAVLMPGERPEAFLLALLDAMACGTPVIARPRGSVPEILEDGVTGLLVAQDEEMATSIEHVHLLDRRRVREAFEERFSAERMAADYVTVYQRLLERERTHDAPPAVEARLQGVLDV
jgi:glycosyltransferase involved in cell wall biosynthesis